MGKEIDLLRKYPKTKRNLEERLNSKSENERNIARKFGKDFFDGDRRYGYGGYNYNPKYWNDVVLDFKEYWNLNSKSSILDVGCGKGFMLYDFKRLIEGINLNGIDISSYAIENCHNEVRHVLKTGNAKKLDFADNESINTVHNLESNECIDAIKEISRVSKKGSFITVDAYRNNEEKKRMYDWNLTAKTILSVDEWKDLFKKINYNGDYYWFIP